MNLNEQWTTLWSEQEHESEYAKKRIQSAKTAKLTPLKIDKEKAAGIFLGSNKEEYTTNLSACTCVDFKRNSKPCKHIYRLAIELGVMNETFSSYKNGKALLWDDVVNKIEELSEDAQAYFLGIITGIKNNERKEFKKKKNDILCELFQTGLVLNNESKNTAQFYAVIIPEDVTAEIFKVHQYFNRKFNPPSDSYYNDNLEEIRVYKPLPNDERTERLLKKGFAIQTSEGIFIKNHLPV